MVSGSVQVEGRAEKRLSATVRPLDPASLDRYRAFAAGRTTGPAQHPVWAKAWGNQPDAKPVLIEIRQSGEPVLMLPLEVVTMQGMRVARFMGGRHANSNFPAISVEALRASEIQDVLRETLASADIPVDALALERMSPEREGRRNPLVFENARPSPNLALAVKLGTPFDVLVKTGDYRGKAKRHRSQLRKFESVGGFERVEAETPEETARILDAFFTLKAGRFKQAGIPDPFATAPVRDAFHALFAEALAEPEPVFRLQALEVQNKPRAVTGSSYGPDRITCEFGAIASDEIAKLSPGELLFFLNIKEAADKGCAFYDFGVGDEPYKRQWCDVEVELRDVFLPLTLKGKALAMGMAASARLKGALKRNQHLWQTFKSLRRRLAGSGDKQRSDR